MGLYHVAGGSGRCDGRRRTSRSQRPGLARDALAQSGISDLSNRAAVRQFIKQRSGGAIFNIASVLGWSPSPRFFATHVYAAAKAAVVGFTKSAAAFYAPLGIRLNVLAPGLIDTPMTQRATRDHKILTFIKTKQPLDGGRMGCPTDLDAAAVYFLSDNASFVTGQILAVDGGWTVSEGQIRLTYEPRYWHRSWWH